MVKNLLISLLLFIKPAENTDHVLKDNNSAFEDEIYPFAPTGLKQSYRSSVVVFSTNDEEVLGSGSGNYFRYKDKSFIVTAAHVIDNEGTIYIGEKNIDVVEATVAYIDKEKDIAILKRMENVGPMYLWFDKEDNIEKFIKIAKLPKNVLEDPDDANEVYDFYQKNRYELDGMFADKVACSTYSKIYDLDLSSSKRKSKSGNLSQPPSNLKF